MAHERGQLKRADVFRKVHGTGMIGRMRGDGMGVMIDTGYNTGTVTSIDQCGLDTGGCSASATEQVNVKQGYEIFFSHGGSI